MLNIYLQQLLEAKKQVYDAMNIGDFNSVQRLMEIYKNMEQKLQLPIYRRISRMTSVEIKQLSEILVSKGINLDLNDNDLKNKIISMFIDEKLITTFKENYRKLDLMSFQIFEPKEGNAEVFINDLSGGEFSKELTVSERVFKKINLDAYSNFRSGIDYGVMEGICVNSKKWSRFEYKSYSIDDIDNIIGTIRYLQKLSGEFIDKASPEYHDLLRMCKCSITTEQLPTPFIIDDLSSLRVCLLEQFCNFSGIKGNIEKSMKESEMIVKTWEDIPLYPNEEEADKYNELRHNLDKATGYSYHVGFPLKTLEQEIFDRPINNSKIASEMNSYISNIKYFSNQRIKRFLEIVNQNEGINDQQFASYDTYYQNPEKIDELINMHRDRIKNIEAFYKLLECDSLDMLKEQASNPFKRISGGEEIIQYLSRIIPRKEVIQQLCKTVFIKLDEVFVKNGFDSYLRKEIINNNDNSKGIDWFELLVKYRDNFDELIKFIVYDWRDIKKLMNMIHEAKDFSWNIYCKVKDSEKTYSGQLKIGDYPTLDSSFEFESDIESLSEYLSEKKGKSK